MVYFLQPVDGGPIKIGFSDDVEFRRVQLEGTYGCPLALLATMNGGRQEEAEIHERFAHLRLGRTEQFRPAADLLTFIGRPLLVCPNPDAVEAMESLTSPTAITIKGAVEWRTWVNRGAEFCRTDMAKLVDAALVEYLKSRGFLEPPPGR